MRRVLVIVFAAVLCVPGRAAQNIVAQTGSQLRSGSTASIAQLYTINGQVLDTSGVGVPGARLSFGGP